MATNTKDPDTLPKIGKSRWAQLRPFIPVSRETWRQLVLAGKAPQPQKLSQRVTAWDNAEIHRWLANPADYKAPESSQTAQ